VSGSSPAWPARGVKASIAAGPASTKVDLEGVRAQLAAGISRRAIARSLAVHPSAIARALAG
jgi:hypothetical protein